MLKLAVALDCMTRHRRLSSAATVNTRAVSDVICNTRSTVHSISKKPKPLADIRVQRHLAPQVTWTIDFSGSIIIEVKEYSRLSKVHLYVPSVSEVLWMYLAHPSCKELIGNIWNGQAIQIVGHAFRVFLFFSFSKLQTLLASETLNLSFESSNKCVAEPGVPRSSGS